MADLISKTDLIAHLDECIAESDGCTPIVDGVLLAVKSAVEQMPSVGTENGGAKMADWQRDKLVELIKDGIRKGLRASGDDRLDYSFEDVADYLLAHGVSVVPSKVREAEK